MGKSENWFGNPDRQDELDGEQKQASVLRFFIEHQKEIMRIFGVLWVTILLCVLSLLITVRIGMSIPLF